MGWVSAQFTDGLQKICLVDSVVCALQNAQWAFCSVVVRPTAVWRCRPTIVMKTIRMVILFIVEQWTTEYAGDAVHNASNADSKLSRAICDNPPTCSWEFFPPAQKHWT